MNKNEPSNQEDQEIDLMQISKKMGRFFERINTRIFKGILFFKRNILILGILFIIGLGLGFFLDRTTKNYNNEIIVSPNFGSTDYLYAKIDLIESKIKENDTVFLKEVIGIKKPKKIDKIEIEPITDVYKFIENKSENFELIKLMAENGDIKKIVEDNLTSKNYPFHTITFATNDLIDNKEVIEPLLNFLNNVDYYDKIKEASVNNIRMKMIQNDTIISQINNVLNGFSDKVNGPKNDKLVYYNENTQLNDIIKTKDNLINEQGAHRLELIGFDRIIKDNSITINIEKTSFAYRKLKFILPILFVFIYIFINFFIAFYKKQSFMAQQNN